MAERYAIYFAPARGSLLDGLAEGWLGGAAVPGLKRGWLDGASISARRYGFHATLKPPMRLRDGASAAGLDAAMAAFAATHAPIVTGQLEVKLLAGFVALVPLVQSAGVTAFAGEVVRHFEPFRAPLTESDRARRQVTGLSARQAELLELYGYPYVLEQFRMHLTLTDRLVAEDRERALAAATDWFAPVLAEDLALDRIALFHEPEAGARFRRLADYPLGRSP